MIKPFKKSFQTRKKKCNPGNIEGGKKAKKRGSEFEDAIVDMAELNGWKITLLPSMGAERVSRFFNKTTKMPFDLLAGKCGKFLLADAKSIDAERISRSHFTSRPHQMMELRSWQKEGQEAGYLVYFRPLDSVVYFKAHQVTSLKLGQSLNPINGIVLGTLHNHNLSKIFIIDLTDNLKTRSI